MVTFRRTPLTDLSVAVDSQVDGGTHSSIVCEDAGGVIGSAGTGFDTDDVTLGVNDLEPGTYTCTVVIDP